MLTPHKPHIFKTYTLIARLWCWWFVFAAAANAQVLPFHQYTVRDGLISNFVNIIMQDSKGYLWIGTTDGISIYDGTVFKNITIADGLPFSHVNAIIESKQHPGTMWLGTNGGGISKFIGNKFMNYRLGSSEWANRVNCVIEDHNGTIWCGADGGLFIQRDSQFIPFPGEKKFVFINDVVETENKYVWIIDKDGLYYYSYAGNGFHPYPIGKGRGNIVNHIYKDKNGDLLGSVSDSSIFRIHDTLIVERMRNLPVEPVSLLDDQTNYYVGSGNGAHIIPKDKTKRKNLKHYTTENGLQDNGIGIGIIDNEGNHWFCSVNNGISKLSEQNILHFPHPITSNAANNLMVDVDSSGHFWINDDEYLNEFWCGEDGTWKLNQYLTAFKQPVALQFDVKGNLWVRYQQEIVCFHVKRTPGKSATLTVVSVLEKDRELDHAGPMCLSIDAECHPWISLQLVGLGHYDPAKQNRPIKIYTVKDSVPGNSSRFIGTDREGNIWAGGYLEGAGVLRNPENLSSRWKLYTTADGLPDNSVRLVWEDHESNIWIGTRYGGASLFKNGTFTTFSKNKGLLSGYVRCMTEDKNNNIYFGTESGVQYLEHDNFSVFKHKEELLGNSVYAAKTNKNGIILFTTMSGWLVYDPSQDHKNTIPPPIYITKFEVNNNSINFTSGLELASNKNNCRISYVGVSFVEERSIRYQYKLDNIDNDWHPPTTVREITYGALKPGTYTFSVRAINNDGILSTQPASIRFTIHPPVWQTWWFIALAAITFGGIIFGLIRIRYRRLIEIERIRARIAADLHDDIGSGLVRIALLSEVIERQSNTEQSGSNEALHDESKEGKYSLTDSSKKVGFIARELVDEMSEVVWTIDPKNDSLDKLVDRIELFANELCEAEGIKLTFDVKEDIEKLKLGSDVLRSIILISKEALTNVIRHAECSNVRVNIRFREREKLLTLEIADDGNGFDINVLQRVNGLTNMRTRAEKVGAAFSIIASAGKGTTIITQFPVAK